MPFQRKGWKCHAKDHETRQSQYKQPVQTIGVVSGGKMIWLESPCSHHNPLPFISHLTHIQQLLQTPSGRPLPFNNPFLLIAEMSHSHRLFCFQAELRFHGTFSRNGHAGSGADDMRCYEVDGLGSRKCVCRW